MSTDTKSKISFTLKDFVEFESSSTSELSLNNLNILELIQGSLTNLLKEDLSVLASKISINIEEDGKSDKDLEGEHTCYNCCSVKEKFVRKKTSDTNTLKQVPELFEKLLNKRKLSSPKTTLITKQIKSVQSNKNNSNSNDKKNYEIPYSPINPISLGSDNEDNLSIEMTAPSFSNNINNISSNDVFDLKSNLDILLCDSFKSSYEASLNQETNKEMCSFNELTLLESFQNYKLIVLYGNISFSINSYEKAINFYKMAINLLNNDKPSVNNKIQIAVLLNNISKCLINLLRINDGIIKLQTALNILKELKDNTTAYSLLITLELNLSDAYYNIENYEQSLDILDKLRKEINNENENVLDSNDKDKFLYKYCKNVGKIAYRLKNYKYALENLKTSLAFLEETDNSNKVELSEIYNYIGLTYLSLVNLELSSFYLNKAFLMFKSMYGEGHVKTLMASLNLVHLYRVDNENNVKVLNILENAISICIKNAELSEVYLAILHRVLGSYYFELGNEVKGLNNFSKANTIHKNYINRSNVSINELNIMIQNMYGIIVI